jgi:hypothetical protein
MATSPIAFRVQDLMVSVDVAKKQFLVQCANTQFNQATCGGGTNTFVMMDLAGNPAGLDALKSQLEAARAALDRITPA